MERAAIILKQEALRERAAYDANETYNGYNTHTRRGLNRTVAVMPFLGTDMGAGHSKLGNRFVYVNIINM